MVNVRTAEYVPVLYFGSSVNDRLTLTVFGSALLQEPPPPVHADAGMETTGVELTVLTVCALEQVEPCVAPLQM
jgi:hypothetical protein